MTLVEIEKFGVILSVTVYRTPIWCFPVYETGKVDFDWFGEGKLGRSVVKAGSLTVNNITYGNAEGLSDPMLLPQKRFCQIGNKVYVKTENDNPLWAFYQSRFNRIIGFTDNKPCKIDGVVYKGNIDYTPKISDEADILEYGRMKFANENITLKNDKGEYDDAADYFGNNVRVKSKINGRWNFLFEYYIKNVKIRENKTVFVCGDRRERLKQKVPNKRFTVDEYPYMKPELEGEIKQDVYGRCEWVKCVCIDELKIYNGKEKESGIKKYRTFYAARKIKSIETVWVKQTQPEAISYSDPTIKNPWSGEVWTNRPIDAAHSDLENGIIALLTDDCMPPPVSPDGSWAEYDVPDVYDVRASGVFWTDGDMEEAAPLHIIKGLLEHYCGIPYDEYWFNKEEIEDEIGSLAPVGIVYDGEIEVFEAIEKLQNSSDHGFRFVADYNRFTARKDNNSRKPVGVIKITDIVDIGNAEIDMRQEHYATIVDIAYKRDYYRDTANHYEGRTNQEELMNIHGIEKIHEPETYLTNKEDAKNKADHLEVFFAKSRVMINNLEVLNRPDLRVYDIVLVDLRIPVERKRELKQVSVLFSGEERESVVYGDWPSEKIAVDFGETEKEEPPYRTFGGILTCKVMGVSLKADTGVNTLNLLEVGE